LLKEKERNNFLGILIMSKPGKVLRTLCKKLGVRLTTKRGKKRVYKSVKVLKAQCKRKTSVKKKSSFGKKKKKVIKEKKKNLGSVFRNFKKNPLDKKELKRMKGFAPKLKTRKDLTKLYYCLDRLGKFDKDGKALKNEKCIDFIVKHTKFTRNSTIFWDGNTVLLVFSLAMFSPLLILAMGYGFKELYKYLRETRKPPSSSEYYYRIQHALDNPKHGKIVKV